MSTRKSLAASGAKISTADIEAAERDRIVAAALRRQQAMTVPTPPEPSADTARVLAALDRLERAPTGDEIASRQAEDRRRYVEARNAKGADANRTYAAQLWAGGYAGWTGGER
jgi:hypothetical protein